MGVPIAHQTYWNNISRSVKLRNKTRYSVIALVNERYTIPSLDGTSPKRIYSLQDEIEMSAKILSARESQPSKWNLMEPFSQAL